MRTLPDVFVLLTQTLVLVVFRPGGPAILLPGLLIQQ